jgi:hypothetical protein
MAGDLRSSDVAPDSGIVSLFGSLLIDGVGRLEVARPGDSLGTLFRSGDAIPLSSLAGWVDADG